MTQTQRENPTLLDSRVNDAAWPGWQAAGLAGDARLRSPGASRADGVRRRGQGHGRPLRRLGLHAEPILRHRRNVRIHV